MQKLARKVLIGYLLVVGVIVFWPTPVDRPIAGSVRRVVDSAHQAGASGLSYNGVEIAANVAMFVPIGLLILLAIPRLRWWGAIAAAVLLSCGIEAVQGVFLGGRTSSLTDVFANSIGAAVGVVLLLALIHRPRIPAIQRRRRR
ncbi:MAG TPA: VanZ family protein [Glaciihabitans sp.]|nr:VanZ family protein [Glaciihabitans sp.]